MSPRIPQTNADRGHRFDELFAWILGPDRDLDAPGMVEALSVELCPETVRHAEALKKFRKLDHDGRLAQAEKYLGELANRVADEALGRAAAMDRLEGQR